MFVVLFSSRFRRSLRKLPSHIQRDFDKRFDVFKKYPFNPTLRTHNLHGSLEMYYAFYLRDGYRVLFEFVDEYTILLINIGSHGDYAHWEKM